MNLVPYEVGIGVGQDDTYRYGWRPTIYRIADRAWINIVFPIEVMRHSLRMTDGDRIPWTVSVGAGLRWIWPDKPAGSTTLQLSALQPAAVSRLFADGRTLRLTRPAYEARVGFLASRVEFAARWMPSDFVGSYRGDFKGRVLAFASLTDVNGLAYWLLR